MERWQSGWTRYLGKVVWGKPHRGFESPSLRQKSKSHFEAEMGSARSADTKAFPPPNPEFKRVFHAPRGSKSTVRSLIWKFEPTFLNKWVFSSFVRSFANSILYFKNFSVSSNRLFAFCSKADNFSLRSCLEATRAFLASRYSSSESALSKYAFISFSILVSKREISAFILSAKSVLDWTSDCRSFAFSAIIHSVQSRGKETFLISSWIWEVMSSSRTYFWVQGFFRLVQRR